MKNFMMILLSAMFVIFSSPTFARGGSGSGGSGGGSSNAGAASSSGDAGDKARDQTHDSSTDRTGTKKQDKDRIHTPGTGTATPSAAPSADKAGIKKQDKDRIHTPGTGTATPAVVPATN
jgi:hypothetical protein